MNELYRSCAEIEYYNTDGNYVRRIVNGKGFPAIPTARAACTVALNRYKSADGFMLIERWDEIARWERYEG